MADVYYRTDSSSGTNMVYIGNDSTAVGSTTKGSVDKGAICQTRRACIVGSTFVLPENATYLFYGVLSFVNDSLDMSLWDTSQCKNMTSMFATSYLYDVDLSNWDLSQVTTMASMFKQCPNLMSATIDTPTPNLTNISSMFSNGGSPPGTGMILSSVSLKGFTVNKVTNMSAMFLNCYQLTKIEVPNDTNGQTEAPSGVSSSDMFTGCNKLPNWDGIANILRANTDGYFSGVRLIKKCNIYIKV